MALTADQDGLVSVPLAPPAPRRRIGVATAHRRPRPLAEALLHALHATVAALPAPAGSVAR